MFNNANEIETLVCRLIDKLNDSETDSLELEIDDVKIKLGKHQEPTCYGIPPQMPMFAPPVMMHNPMPTATATSANEPMAAPSSVPQLATVNAPLIGVAYAAAAPDAAPFVKVGDRVKKGDIICIIEAMKVMNEIESDRDGEIAEILFKNGNMVEFGQPLVSVK